MVFKAKRVGFVKFANIGANLEYRPLEEDYFISLCSLSLVERRFEGNNERTLVLRNIEQNFMNYMYSIQV